MAVEGDKLSLRRPSLAFWAGLIAMGAGILGLPLGLEAQLSPPLKLNFPVTLPAGSGIMRAGHAAIADLGLTPGHKSIIFGTSTGKLYVIKYDGTVATGFPVTLPSEIAMTPAVADLDGDGKPEIVVGYGSTFVGTSAPGGLRAYHRDGTLMWSAVVGDFDNNGVPDAVVSSPAIGDVDGDGVLEVAFGGFDGNVHLVNGVTGQEKPGWPHFVRDSIYSSPSLHDIDGDGLPDIIIGVDAHKEGPPYNTPNGGCLHVFRYDATEVTGFPQCVDQVMTSSPAVGDITGDGQPEIVIGTGTYWNSSNNGTGISPKHVVYAFRCDGTAVPGWPVPVDGQVFTSPALGDLDGDGIPDVVVTDDNSGPSRNYHCYAFKGTGAQLFKVVPINFFGSNPALNAGDPVIADVAGDSKPEVLLPTNTEACVLSNTGAQLTNDGSHPSNLSYYTESALSGVDVEDMESDGAAVEVVAVSSISSTNAAKVYVWNPKASSPEPWGVYKQNVAHTGVVPGTPACSNGSTPPPSVRFNSLSPCRVIDTRNANSPLGGPPLTANSSRLFAIANACGIPSTAKAVAANVTVTETQATGNLVIYPGDLSRPLFSSISFLGNETRASNSIVKLATDGSGTIKIYNQSAGSVQVIVDVSGFFQ